MTPFSRTAEEANQLCRSPLLHWYRITGQLRLEETSGGLQPKLLLQARAAPTSELVTQSFIQSGPENLQGHRLYYSAGQLVPLLHCPNGEKGFSYILKHVVSIASMLPEYQISWVRLTFQIH